MVVASGTVRTMKSSGCTNDSVCNKSRMCRRQHVCFEQRGWRTMCVVNSVCVRAVCGRAVLAVDSMWE